MRTSKNEQADARFIRGDLLHTRSLDTFDYDQILFLVKFIVNSISFDDDPPRFCPRSSGVLAISLIGTDMKEPVLNRLDQMDLKSHRFFCSEASAV